MATYCAETAPGIPVPDGSCIGQQFGDQFSLPWDCDETIDQPAIEPRSSYFCYLTPSSGVIPVPELSSYEVGLAFSCGSLEVLAGDLQMDHNDPCNTPLDIRFELQCRDTKVFNDGFESGDTSCWSATASP
jgi:hypothetical protein